MKLVKQFCVFLHPSNSTSVVLTAMVVVVIVHCSCKPEMCSLADANLQILYTDIPTCEHSAVTAKELFSAAGPRLWNSFLVQLRNPDITYELFR